jgi:hypothetical protein
MSIFSFADFRKSDMFRVYGKEKNLFPINVPGDYCRLS